MKRKKKLRCFNCGRHVRMSDARCRSCCNRTPWWYIYIFIFVMILVAGILYAFNELMKGAGLVSRVNRGSYHAALNTGGQLLSHPPLPVPAMEDSRFKLRSTTNGNRTEHQAIALMLLPESNVS